MVKFHEKRSVQLNLANKLWIHKEYGVKETFESILKKYFQVTVDKVNFKTNTEQIRLQINKWVAQKTQQKIQNLLSLGSLNNLTRLVLVNAIYFKGDWQLPFEGTSTFKQMFHKNKRESKLVDMMAQEKKFQFTEDQALDVKVIQLPYKNFSLSMRIILPNKVDGLAELETSLNFEKLQTLVLEDRRYRKVDVKFLIPKFKLELNFPLKSCLMELEMIDLFDIHSSNLSGMSEENDLFVSDALHKAFINVDEKGTEAAAVTSMVLLAGCAFFEKKVEVFKADHPFLFCIYDCSINSILFMGRLVDILGEY